MLQLRRARSLIAAPLALQPRARAALAAAVLLTVALALALEHAGHAAAQRVAAAASLSEQNLTATEESGAGRFGASVAVSADGSTALVGAPADNGSLGAVWVYARSSGGWEQQGPKLVPEAEKPTAPCEESESEPEPCGFGRSVALSANGDVALVGSPRNKGSEGAAWVYTRSGSTWTRTELLTAGVEAVGTSRFGRSVALSGDGTIALVGGARDSDGHGATWVFVHTSAGWERKAKLTPPVEPEQNQGFFGASVALSRNATTALIGAPGRNGSVGSAWLFTRSGEDWTRDPEPLVGGSEETGSGRFGYSVALSAEGTLALVGARTDNGRVGAAWAFAYNGTAWIPQKLVGSGEAEAFGYSVALSANGEQAVVGAPAAAQSLGRVWFFARSGSTFSPFGTSVTGRESADERLGQSVALSQSGAAWLFGAPGTNSRVGAALALLATPTAPAVKSVTPAAGPSAGGTAVTIEGSGFLPDAKVTIGGEASAVEFISESKLTARTGAHPAGKLEVVVSDKYGTSTEGPSFTYEPPPPPVVTSISPPSGPSEGGTLVTIEGSGFTPDVKVTIGGQATSVEFISETKLIVRTPPTASGSYEVLVSNEGGSSKGGPHFTYEPPPPITPGSFLPTPGHDVLGTTTLVVAAPVLAVTGNIAPVSGKVYVRLPGTKKFVLLTGLESIPFGTIVDARLGTVTVTTMGKNGLQSSNFYEGEFVITQSRNGVATASLFGGSYAVCPTKRERAHKAALASAHRSSRNHVVRKLWASGHGTYSTRGNYATGAVLGTVWETIDRCNGTGIHVVTDVVLVTNLVNHKKVRVKPGHTYIAKAP